MLSETEKTLLQELLALSPVPEDTFSYHELMGFMFGVAITPVTTDPNEWLGVVFGETGPGKGDLANSMTTILRQIFHTFLAREQSGTLEFPYEPEILDQCDLEEVVEWVSGFEEALSLRPEIWEPAKESELESPWQEQVFFSLMVIQGLVDPEEMMPFFANLPDELLAEAFIAYDPGILNREMQIHAMLIATLPLAVSTLRRHAAWMADKLPCRLQSATAATSNRQATSLTTAVNPRKGKVIEVDFGNRRKKSARPAPHHSYQLKISLHGAKPPIWRRVLVPDTITLAELHMLIQLTMGWMDNHLHQFQIGHSLFGPLVEDGWSDETLLDEMRYTLYDLADFLSPYFLYTYDFGDDWQHRIIVEKQLAESQEEDGPTLLKGKRACPPEDSGGIPGYHRLLEAYHDPDHEKHREVRRWVGHDFDPARFDADERKAINEVLKGYFH